MLWTVKLKHAFYFIFWFVLWIAFASESDIAVMVDWVLNIQVQTTVSRFCYSEIECCLTSSVTRYQPCCRWYTQPPGFPRPVLLLVLYLLTKSFALLVDQMFCLACWPNVLPYLLTKHFASPVDQRFCFTWLILQTHCMPCGVWPNFIFLQCVNLLAICTYLSCCRCSPMPTLNCIFPLPVILQVINTTLSCSVFSLPVLPQAQYCANFNLKVPLTCHSTGD